MAHKIGSTSGSTVPFVFYYTSNSGTPNVGLNYMAPAQPFNTSTTYTRADLDIVIPLAGTLNKVYGIVEIAGTLGSTETVGFQIRKNNVVQSTINMQFNVASQTFSSTSLGISLSAGDKIQISFNCPAWVTTPTSVSWSGGFEVD